jgi:hypothetical protein
MANGAKSIVDSVSSKKADGRTRKLGELEDENDLAPCRRSNRTLFSLKEAITMAGSVSSQDAETLDYTNMPVADEGRMGPMALTMAYWSCCSAMVWLIIAATLASVYGTKNAIIGLVLTIISYGVINIPIVRYAIKTGTSVSLFSRVLFGRNGSAIATLVFAITSIWYAVFEGSVVAVAGNYLYSSIDYKWASLIVVLYSVPLILGSVQKWLDKFNGYLLPLYIVGLAVTVGVSISKHGYSNDWLNVQGTNPSPTGWWDVYVGYMGVWIMMMFTFDFARFGRKQDVDFHANFNFGVPFYAFAMLLNGFIGIFLVNTIPLDGGLSEVSVVKAIIAMMGLLGFIFIWITQTRINTANYYLATVNLESMGRLITGRDLPKFVWAIVVGIFVFILMLANIFHYLLLALAYQGIFVVAWVGVAVAYIVGQGSTEPENAAGRQDHEYPAFNQAGMVAWFSAVAVGIIFMNIPSLANFSAPLTAVLSFGLFWMFGKRAVLASA